jgi:hypothetical protein
VTAVGAVGVLGVLAVAAAVALWLQGTRLVLAIAPADTTVAVSVRVAGVVGVTVPTFHTPVAAVYVPWLAVADTKLRPAGSTVVFGADYLAYLTKKVGSSQLVAGTDGPVDFGQPRVCDLLEAAAVPAPDRERIAHANAEQLLAFGTA